MEIKLNGFACGRTDIKPSGEVCSHNNEQMHSELNLSFWSRDEHQVLPFHGVVHIGYFCPEGFNPIGKSRLQSIVHFYGFKLQVQERLTKQIAETASLILGGDIRVVVEANHTCMIFKGIEKFGSNTATIAVLGRFSTDPAARTIFFCRAFQTHCARRWKSHTALSKEKHTWELSCFALRSASHAGKPTTRHQSRAMSPVSFICKSVNFGGIFGIGQRQ